MTIQLGGKELETGVLNGKKLEEVWYGGKKVRPEGVQPRMHDGEIRFWVNVKVERVPFRIAMGCNPGFKYDWDISIDGSPPMRYKGNGHEKVFIDVPVPIGEHYVKITPHGNLVEGRACRMGHGGYSSAEWTSNRNLLEFSLEYIPVFAFRESKYWIGSGFFNQAFKGCQSLVSLPKEIKIPENEEIGERFLYQARMDCYSITSIPETFVIRDTPIIRRYFMKETFYNCYGLKSNAPAHPFRFPVATSGIFVGSYAERCFGGSCPIKPKSPIQGSSVMISN